MIINKWMKAAIQEAFRGMQSNAGGPFGAVIVQNDRIIARGHNQVIQTNDPTAHAEIMAIRHASRKTKSFDLADCEIYSTCEPCPMCLGAIHWAKIKRLYFGCNRHDAANIGFDDQFIYEVLAGTADRQQVQVTELNRAECLPLFEEWLRKTDKVQY